jgi:hypothetical protein
MSGWYWVWRLGKDIDRNISEPMYWSNGKGWHIDSVDPNVTSVVPFAAWVGPLEARCPPEREEEIHAQYTKARVVRVAPIPALPAGELGGVTRCGCCYHPARVLLIGVPSRDGSGVPCCADAACAAKIRSGIDRVSGLTDRAMPFRCLGCEKDAREFFRDMPLPWCGDATCELRIQGGLDAATKGCNRSAGTLDGPVCYQCGGTNDVQKGDHPADKFVCWPCRTDL